MQTEFIQMQLTKTEALECLRALLSQALLEEEVLMQKGLEPPEFFPVLARLVHTLGASDDEIEKITSRASEELWEYSWYVFTNEWAWFRARQEAMRERRKKIKKTSDEKKEDEIQIAERLYKRHFERYVNELNMRSLADKRIKTKTNQRKNFPTETNTE